MFTGLTVSGLLTSAGDVVETLMPVVLVVVGISLGFGVVNWVKRALAKAR